MLLLIDNYDSFTYNLYQGLCVGGASVEVVRNDVCSVEELLAKKPQAVVLSPGPGTPKQAGNLIELINKAKGHYPMLGICLGHQAIVECYGGVVGHAGETVHGKSSLIELKEHAVFSGLHSQIPVARYHSLMATEVPDSLDVIASYDTIPMAIIQEQDNVIGFQFHPESILTPNGSQLLKQSLAYLANVEGA